MGRAINEAQTASNEEEETTETMEDSLAEKFANCPDVVDQMMGISLRSCTFFIDVVVECLVV